MCFLRCWRNWTLHVCVWEKFHWNWLGRALKTFAADFLSSEGGNSKGRMKSSTLFTLDHASFSTWLSAAQLFLGRGSRTTNSYPILNECPDHKIIVLAPSLLDQLLIPRLLMSSFYADFALAEGVNSNFNLLLFSSSREVWNLSPGREPKMHFHVLEWHSAILKNVWRAAPMSLPLLQAWFQK